MTTIMVAVILICIITAICVFLVLINNRDKRRRAVQLLDRFKRWEKEHQLLCTEEGVFENYLIGLDEEKRKLLIVKATASKEFTSDVIDIDDLKGCSVRKEFNKPDGENFKRLGSDRHLDRIILECEYQDKRQPLEIIFYEPAINYPYEIAELKQKAKHWEIVISRKLRNQLQYRA